MLKIVVTGEEKFDEETETFVPAMKPYTLTLEHSLLSVSKWEGIYHKPFLSTDKDLDMIKTYAKCMTINPNVPEEVYEKLTPKHIEEISSYIEDKQTATWFSDGEKAHKNGKMNGEVITAEIVYYWMISMQIPVEFQKWHLNRLLTLIRVISIKNDPKGSGKKMSYADRRALNAARKAKYHTMGVLDKYGREGVTALSMATPVDTGKTAASWRYRITSNATSLTIEWLNDNETKDGIPIVVLIQYGHGTGNGGYVQGRDFVNPAIQPIFDKIADTLWKEVTK